MASRGEFDLIEAIRQRLPSGGDGLRVGSGDDAAVVEDRGAASAITVDAMIEGVHFTLPAFSPEAVATVAGLLDGHPGASVDKGTIRFQPEHPLPDDALRRLVRARLSQIDGA